MKSFSATSKVIMFCSMAVLACLTAIAAERPEISLRIIDRDVQIGTTDPRPFYTQWRLPEGTNWYNLHDTLDPITNRAVWLRAVFWDDDMFIAKDSSSDETIEEESELSWKSVGQFNTKGELLPPDDVLAMYGMTADETDEGTIVYDNPPTKNNQARATPDPGKAIIYWLHGNDGRFATWFLSSSGVRKASNVANATAPGGWQVVGTGDINRNGVTDIMWFRPSDGAMAYWLMEPDGYRKAAGSMNATAPGGWQVVGTGDIDGDGVPDIMWFRPSDGAMAYWFLNADGSRKAASLMDATAPGGWQVVGTGDIDGDGVPDIMWFRPSDGRMSYWLLNSNGTRKAAGLMDATAPGGWQVVGTGDIDGDGVPDIMWFRPSDGRMSYWLLNSNGTRKDAGSMGATATGGWQVVGIGSL